MSRVGMLSVIGGRKVAAWAFSTGYESINIKVMKTIILIQFLNLLAVSS
jgi:hypothetical protein